MEQNTPSQRFIHALCCEDSTKSKLMKKIAYLAVTAALALSPLAFTTGCAVTSGQESAGAYTHDKEIQTKIKTSLYKDKLVKGTQVEVNSLNGVVQLSGFVDSPEAKARAGEIASSTKGVVQVYNNLLLPTGR
jgi:hyperosmotically inducible protein